MSDILNTEEKKPEDKKFILPVLPLRGLPVFPYMLIHFDVARDKSLKAVKAAIDENRKIFLVAQIDPDIEEVNPDNLYRMGTVCTIKQVLHMANGDMRLLVEGGDRAVALEYIENPTYWEGVLEDVTEEEPTDENDLYTAEAYVNELKAHASEYFALTGRMPAEIGSMFIEDRTSSQVADIIASVVDVGLEDKQKLMEELNVLKRLDLVLKMLYHETAVLRVEKEITIKAKKRIDDSQREYFLREQLKAINEELGNDDGTDGEVEEYRRKMSKLAMPNEVEDKLDKELNRLSKLHPSSPDAGVIRSYVDYVLELPWGVKSEENEDLSRAKQILEDSHYGLEKVKERILEFLAVRKLSEGKKSPVICLVGPPGVGKTSIVKAVAESIGRKYVRMSLGGVHDEAEVRGHRRTYIGAMAGRIAEAVKQAQTMNPLILLDEIDKVGADYRGNVSAALLEVLDTEQNFSFRDHYLEVALDLSDVMFFTTANSLDTIDRPLLDRMEIIELNGYTDEEKLHIAMNYIIPKQTAEAGLKKPQVRINEKTVLDIIHFYTRESGVRELERKIAAIMRKIASEITTTDKKSVTVSSKNIEKFLERKIYTEPTKNSEPTVGVATGLAWTQYGGDTLSIEVNALDGDGSLELTGQMGDVMKESAKAAISYVRSNARTLGIESDFYNKKDLHIHIPEGAVPKDGPSAGITMATAIVSSLTGKKVSCDVAMTGEITITGRILPIGGLKEKSLAAYRAGIKTVLIPKENVADTYDLPEQIRKDINFVVADSMDKVLSTALSN